MSKLKDYIKLSNDKIEPVYIRTNVGSRYGQTVSGTGMPPNNIVGKKRVSSFGGESWKGRVGFSRTQPLTDKNYTRPICKGTKDDDER